MVSGILLDRDGVINRNRSDYVKSWDEFEFLPGTLDALRKLARLGLPIVILTNQSAIGRGLVSPSVVEDIHKRMIAAVRLAGGRIDDVLYCPHRPEETCACRKPAPGLLHEAASRWRLDLAHSYMVGDAMSDVMAARAASCRPILVKTGRGADQVAKLDVFEARDVRLAVDLNDGADLIFRELMACGVTSRTDTSSTDGVFRVTGPVADGR